MGLSIGAIGLRLLFTDVLRGDTLPGRSVQSPGKTGTQILICGKHESKP